MDVDVGAVPEDAGDGFSNLRCPSDAENLWGTLLLSPQPWKQVQASMKMFLLLLLLPLQLLRQQRQHAFEKMSKANVMSNEKLRSTHHADEEAVMDVCRRWRQAVHLCTPVDVPLMNSKAML